MNKPLSILIFFILCIICGSISAQVNIPTNITAPGVKIARKLPDAYHKAPYSYTRIYTPVKPIQDTAMVNMAAPVEDINITTAYEDSYGRLLQTVNRQSTPTKNDLVVPQLYDEFGNSSFQYLPFASQAGNNDGKFKLNAFTQDSAFYKQLLPNEQINYAQSLYDGSPLNLPVKSSAPGNSWTGAGVGSVIARRANANSDSVRLWIINISGENDIPVTTGVIQAGALLVHEVTDEKGNKTLTFTDQLGRTILTKQQVRDQPSSGHTGWLCTYNVYDEMNHLRYVITPKAVEALNTQTVAWDLTANNDIAVNLCYSYFYDSRGRVIIKHIPGKGKMYMVYDFQNRLVFSQDPGMRNQTQWRSFLYDGMNRPVILGLLNYSGSRGDLQTLVMDQTKPESGNAETVVVEGVNVNRNPLPTGYVFKYLSINYYDDYSWMQGAGATFTDDLVSTNINSTNFITNYNVSPEYAQPIVKSSRIRGALTGNKKSVLNSNNFLYNIRLYDDRLNVIQILETNISSATNVATFQYSFSGNLLRTHTHHEKGGSNAQTHSLLTKYMYDHAGRLLSVTKKLNNSSEKIVSQFDYNELGQIKSKVFGAGLETQNYSYNIRGWMTGINEGYVGTPGTTSNYFGESISYDYGFVNSQLNGAIAGIKWKTAGDGVSRAYGFTYDRINRLTEAYFAQQNEGSTSWENNKVDFSVSGLSYDANGNILSMKQRGLKPGVSVTIDSLIYDYWSNSNRLKKVSDGIGDLSPMGDFKDTSLINDDYNYDANGNITKDYNRHMHTAGNGAGAVYNFLNKPDSIIIANKGRVVYTYDAAGILLSKQVKDDSGSVKNYLYVNGFVYLNDTLQYVLHEEGRIRYAQKKNSVTGSTYYAYEYDYFIRDHLSNVRTVLTDGRDTAVYAATMETGDSATVSALFGNVYSPARTIHAKPAGFDTDNTNQFVSRLNASSAIGKKTGLSLVLKVMAGDKVQINTYAYYNTVVQPPPANIDLLSEIISILGNGVVNKGVGKFGSADIVGIGNAISPSVAQFLNNRTYDDNKPKAYLNWILFDNQFNYVASNSGVQQVMPGSSKQALVAPLQSISKNGYLYIYVSNESEQDVYFDDLVVKHETGPLLQEQSFYPFGLEMAGISDKALLQQEVSEKFNGGIELEEDFGINYYNTFYRKYDPQIGRFSGIDLLAEQTMGINPYQFGLNNPLLFIDPSGALSQQELDEILNTLFGSTYGGTWHPGSGGYGSYSYFGGSINLFGSHDQAFGYGFAYMDRNNLWGRGVGWATSGQQALQRFSNGQVTSGMVEGYYMYRQQGAWFNIIADKSTSGTGFNVSYSTQFTQTMTNVESHYVSVVQMMRLFGYRTSFSEWIEVGDKANDVMGVGLDAASYGLQQLDRVATIAIQNGAGVDEIRRGLAGTRTLEKVARPVGWLGKASGAADAAIAIGQASEVYNDPNATTMAKTGAIAKAVFKTALVFVKVNPLVGVALGIADITGFTDWVFDW